MVVFDREYVEWYSSNLGSMLIGVAIYVILTEGAFIEKFDTPEQVFYLVVVCMMLGIYLVLFSKQIAAKLVPQTVPELEDSL